MPQKRSVPFSGKKKKDQLRQKKSQKNAQKGETSELTLAPDGPRRPSASGDKVMSKSEKYKLLFQRETREMIDAAKRVAQGVVIEPHSDLTISVEDIYDNIINFPTRPDWRGNSDPKKINSIEEIYFDEFLSNIHEKYDISTLSYFEHNLETWRQLWRVLDLSDLVCIVADVRHPVLHFPPSLFRHIIATSKKVILILSKIDLVQPELYVAWKKYFETKFPTLQVIGFTCFDRFTFKENKNIQKKRNRAAKFGNQFSSQFGPVELGKAVQTTFPDIELADWIETLEDVNKRELVDIGHGC